MSAFAIRILLIASLAAWSPAWCCCAIRAMAAGEASGEFSCCSRDVRTQAQSSGLRSCCDFRTRTGCCEADDEDSPSPCRCADRIIEQQRLDTSVRMAAPRIAIDHGVVLESIAGTPRATSPFIASAMQPWSWHPPPRTLLAQSCMLLV